METIYHFLKVLNRYLSAFRQGQRLELKGLKDMQLLEPFLKHYSSSRTLSRASGNGKKNEANNTMVNHELLTFIKEVFLDVFFIP